MNHYKPEDDWSLLDRLRNNESTALDEIYKRYATLLVTFASSKVYSLDTAKDIIQDLFTQLWLKKESLIIKDSLKAFLFSSVKYRIIDHIRKNAVRQEYAVNLQLLEMPVSNNAEQAIEEKEILEQISKAINHLSPKVKQVYKLSRESHMSTAEIAKQLNVSEQTVKNQLTAALKYLRISITKLTAVLLYLLLR